jgi:hypothetical protein
MSGLRNPDGSTFLAGFVAAQLVRKHSQTTKKTPNNLFIIHPPFLLEAHKKTAGALILYLQQPNYCITYYFHEYEPPHILIFIYDLARFVKKSQGKCSHIAGLNK